MEPLTVRPGDGHTLIGGMPKIAKKHAREHGAALLVRADDSAVLFYRDGGKIRQKTFHEIRIREF